MTKIREGYKETEIGVIPEEWEVVKLIDISNSKGEYGIGAKAVDFIFSKPRYLRITDIDGFGRLINSDFKTIAEEEYENYLLKENDLVFARTGNTTGKTYLYNSKDGELVYAGFLIKFGISESKAVSEFVKYFCQTKYYWDWISQSSTRSGQPGINSKQYGELLISSPPIQEQQRIANILSSTDEHIEKLDKTIEDYQLLKKGMMKKLLTEGIGHTEFKDTEIGRIPREWEVNKIDNCVTKIHGGGTPSRSNMEYYSGNIPWITVKDLDDKFYKHEASEYITEEAVKNSATNLIQENSIIIATRMGLGRGFINTRPVAINQDMKALILKKDIDNKYFLYWYLSKTNMIESLGTGTTVKGIRLETLKEFKLPIPPLTEQQHIAEILSTTNEHIEKLDKIIEDYQLLKKALMEQLLTGKIRVKQ